MKIAILVLLFVYIVAFFWILWKSAANLRWYHMVALTLTMFITIPLLPLTAAVLKSRTAWSQLAQDLERRLQSAEREQEDLINGVEGDPQRDPGVRELQTELRSINAEVGRVFRDMDVAAGPNGFVLTKSADTPQTAPDGLPIDPNAEPAAADPNAPAAGPLLGVGSIVYGFAENTLSEGGPMVPVFYIGEFRVTQAAGDSMTLVPTRPLDPPQLQAANNAVRWALYELMPVDSHEAFVAEGSAPDDKEIFGRVDSDLVNQLLGRSVPQEVLDAYLRDGTVARSDDPPATHWIRITFTEKYEHTVDAMEQRSAIDGGFFDGLGQAVDSRLQRADGDTVTFEPGDQLTLKAEAAEDLLQRGIATKDQDYFVRPMNSYRFVLAEIRRQIDYLNDQSEGLVRQKAVLEAALTLTTEMQTKGQQRQLDLEKDERQLAKELAAIQGYADRLESELTATKSKMAELYRQNLSGERELEAIQASIRQASEERAALAVGG